MSREGTTRMFRAGELVKGFKARTVPRERTALAIWFWEIDRVLLSLIVALIGSARCVRASSSVTGSSARPRRRTAFRKRNGSAESSARRRLGITVSLSSC